MPDEPQEPKVEQDENEPREKTATGFEVRTPRRGEFFENLKRVSEPEPEE